MMMTAAKMPTCAAIERGTVYHFCDPTLTVGSVTSPNMSRGTAQPSHRRGARPRIIVRRKNQCQRTSHVSLRHRFRPNGAAIRPLKPGSFGAWGAGLSNPHSIKRTVYEERRPCHENGGQHMTHHRSVLTSK